MNSSPQKLPQVLRHHRILQRMAGHAFLQGKELHLHAASRRGQLLNAEMRKLRLHEGALTSRTSEDNRRNKAGLRMGQPLHRGTLSSPKREPVTEIHFKLRIVWRKKIPGTACVSSFTPKMQYSGRRRKFLVVDAPEEEGTEENKAKQSIERGNTYKDK